MLNWHHKLPWALLCAPFLLFACEAGTEGSGGDGGTGGNGGGAGGGNGTCPTVTGTAVRFDPELQALGESEALNWLAFPFPADHRRTETGNADFDDWPFQYDILDDYCDHASENIDGFGTNTPIYLAFDAALQPSSLPTYAHAFMSSEAVIQLVDITAGSPEYGTRWPLRWMYNEVEGNWVTPNMLAVAPEWGFPLREQTTYALLITNDLIDAEGDRVVQPPLLNHLLGGDAPASCGGPSTATLFAQFAPLRGLLASDSIPIDTIAVATVFTTQTITQELGDLYTDVHDNLPEPTLNHSSWVELDEPDVYWEERQFQWTANEDDVVSFWVMEGRYDAPNYQTGDKPYASLRDGGFFNQEEGLPAVDHWESLRFFLTIPQTPPPDGNPCYPIVEYAHGTTGTATGFIGSKGGRNAARGLATIGIDQPLHGHRWSGSGSDSAVALYSFNFFNPEAYRTLFRQSAADTFYLTRFIKSALVVPADKSPTGQRICFDDQRISFLGHSHGGISGAIAAAYEGDVENWVLSGGGGGLSITVMLRNDDFTQPAELIRALLPFAPGEELSEMHPVIGLIQHLSEITDPVNYSPFWLDLPTYAPARNIFVTSGELDEATPHRTATAMAVAARIPIIDPVQIPVPGFVIAGLPSVAAPLSLNVDGTHTAGFMQWGDDGQDASHWVAFTRPEAINAHIRFFQSAVYEEAAVLERDPSSLVR